MLGGGLSSETERALSTKVCSLCMLCGDSRSAVIAATSIYISVCLKSEEWLDLVKYSICARYRIFFVVLRLLQARPLIQRILMLRWLKNML